MRVMLTSCGLETKQIEHAFLSMLGKAPVETKALFIPTAAIDAGAIMVLPKCLNDLLKIGIPEENISVFDLHCGMSVEAILKYDVVYLCGGRTQYLLDRINATGFCDTLKQYIARDGMVIGVSAGSLIFADNLPDNLGLIQSKMSVHCGDGDPAGKLTFPLRPEIRLSNTAAILVREIPEDCVLIDD